MAPLSQWGLVPGKNSFYKTPEVVSSVTLFDHGNIRHSGVVLSAQGRTIIAIETGGLHFMMMLHTLFFRILKLLSVSIFSLRR